MISAGPPSGSEVDYVAAPGVVGEGAWFCKPALQFDGALLSLGHGLLSFPQLEAPFLSPPSGLGP